MIIKKAELETVAVKRSQYPEDNVPEIAFAGRSNVGKSSLQNRRPSGIRLCEDFKEHIRELGRYDGRVFPKQAGPQEGRAAC